MPKEFTCEKNELRLELKSRRAELADKPQRAELATERALSLITGGNVLVYVSIGSELDTFGLIENLLHNPAVKIFVPHTAGGIIEALPLERLESADKLGNLPSECYGAPARNVKIDICVTPLLGFNSRGYRLGYGKGCYDRFFACSDAYKMGLAFDCQLCEFSPEPHDVPLDCCVTETKVIYFDHARNIG